MSVLLFVVKPLSAVYFLLYFICVISDIADGIVARRLNISSESGASLDSTADLIFALSVFFTVIPQLIINKIFIIIIIITAVLRLSALATGVIKFKRVTLWHTLSDKTAGVSLVLVPFALKIDGILYLISFITLIASAEEMLVAVLSTEYDPNTKSIIKIGRHKPSD